jgi:hypothetical protein
MRSVARVMSSSSAVAGAVFGAADGPDAGTEPDGSCDLWAETSARAAEESCAGAVSGRRLVEGDVVVVIVGER